MSFGVFVQINKGSHPRTIKYPVGYVIQENGCWDWVGATAKGYGVYQFEGRQQPAHRMIYVQTKGPVPEGLDLDHLCRNRLCVNPDHLEPVTRRENLIRGDTVVARHVRKTHCHIGHPFDEANTYLPARGERACRACRRLAELRRQPRRKEPK